jgi:hypothetical protein
VRVLPATPATVPVPGEAPSPRVAVRVIGAVFLIVALAAAVSVDVVKTGYGVKSDEATYVMMALSVAYDHDLVYERRDLDRFAGLYHAGPSGVFLKGGKQMRVRINATPPFLHLNRTPEIRTDRLYFGKALIYSVAAAPFVRLLGLNGFLVFNVLLIGVAVACGYTLLAQRARAGPAFVYTLAFVGATCVPVYVVFFTPEVFHFALVFMAYFLWLYKDSTRSMRSRFLTSRATDFCAAALLGVATYSKPSHALLVGPIVLWLWWRRKYARGLAVGVACVVTTAALFGANALVTGEFNFQGGDRKYFVSSPTAQAQFPLDAYGMTAWYQRGVGMSTNDSDAANVLKDFQNRFVHNVAYFAVGRHFGFLPYFFPGLIALGLWLFSRDRHDLRRVFTFLAVVATVVALLVFFPYTWSGGGGPPGNRYFMSIYPALFFLTPADISYLPGLLAWLGGALFTAKMLVNPFYAAKNPQVMAERGFVRRLPVELTMANDLPIMLDSPRAHIWFSDVLLYFLDEHAHTPEKIDAEGHEGIWVAGDGRADILMRCEWPIDHLRITAESPVRTVFIVSAGGRESQIPVAPGLPTVVDVPTVGVRDLGSYAYLLSAQSTEAFTPALTNPASTDFRNLGVLIRFTAVPAEK